MLFQTFQQNQNDQSGLNGVGTAGSPWVTTKFDLKDGAFLVISLYFGAVDSNESHAQLAGSID